MARPKGGYKTKDGKRAEGVTTIIGRFKDSGALLWWAFEQGKAAERGEIKSLYDKRDAAADAGTLAHSLVEAHIKKQPLPKLPDNDIGKAAQQGYENYLQWESNSRITFVETEIELVSETYRFGGCPDAIGMDTQGRACIIDFKTSSSGPYTDWLLQLAAYKILWLENHPLEPIIGGFHLLKFSKENADFSHFYWSELNEAEEYFILILKAYSLDKKLKKRI